MSIFNIISEFQEIMKALETISDLAARVESLESLLPSVVTPEPTAPVVEDSSAPTS
jgi:hypothetical protein